MRSLILLILLFPSIAMCKNMAITSGVFCQTIDGMKSMFKELDRQELGGQALLSDYGCARLKTTQPLLAVQKATYQTVTNKGVIYHVYMFKLIGYSVTMFGFSEKPPPTVGWGI